MSATKNSIAYAQYILPMPNNLYLLQSNRERKQFLHSRHVLLQKKSKKFINAVN